jgi:hypothetical protein
VPGFETLLASIFGFYIIRAVAFEFTHFGFPLDAIQRRIRVIFLSRLAHHNRSTAYSVSVSVKAVRNVPDSWRINSNVLADGADHGPDDPDDEDERRTSSFDQARIDPCDAMTKCEFWGIDLGR